MDTHVLFGATGTTVLDFWWRLLWDSKPGWFLPYLLFAEANVMYIPWDPPLVLNLLTSWQLVCSRSCPHILVQRWGCQDSNSCSQNICESDALPTELNRDRHYWINVTYENKRTASPQPRQPGAYLTLIKTKIAILLKLWQESERIAQLACC